MRIKLLVLIVAFGVGPISGAPEAIIHTKTVLRQIGHEWLWQLGDSTSLIHPIQNLDTRRYRMAFEGEFGFIPDSIANFFIGRFKHYQINPPYQIMIKACQDTAVIYSWEIHLRSENNIVPCLGREFPKACYVVDIELLEAPAAQSYSWWLMGLLILGAGIGGYRLYSSRKPLPVVPVGTLVHFGKFALNTTSFEIYFDQQKINLTEKEGKLLKLLVAEQGQVVERERMLKEVWDDDDGLLVTRSADVFISRLRKYLRADPQVRLVAVHGQGYRLDVMSV